MMRRPMYGALPSAQPVTIFGNNLCHGAADHRAPLELEGGNDSKDDITPPESSRFETASLRESRSPIPTTRNGAAATRAQLPQAPQSLSKRASPRERG